MTLVPPQQLCHAVSLNNSQTSSFLPISVFWLVVHLLVHYSTHHEKEGLGIDNGVADRYFWLK